MMSEGGKKEENYPPASLKATKGTKGKRLPTNYTNGHE